MANMGCGTVNSSNNTVPFYVMMGKKARNIGKITPSLLALVPELYQSVFFLLTSILAPVSGTSVSIITMEGEDCSMENLGTVADITGGGVEIVDPLDLQGKVTSLLSNNFVGSSMTCTVLANSELIQFTGEKGSSSSVVFLEVGNVNQNTDLTFAFEPSAQLKSLLENQRGSEEEKREDDRFCKFQVQLEYVNPKGERVLRILTSSVRTTTDRGVAEKSTNSLPVSLRSIHLAASLAQEKHYDEARWTLISTMRLLQRAMETAAHQKDYLNFIVQGENLDQFMREAQHQEKTMGRILERDDESAKAIYQMKSVSASVFIESHTR
jgi:hypothetical protein